ncbi:MAG: efflux RND transporter periplasmic adaptor subunit [Muribaculaceae bacterium]|nr:efflux RND transporter periplasmic adaptor subunit [Muribaculaceae bacterium]
MTKKKASKSTPLYAALTIVALTASSCSKSDEASQQTSQQQAPQVSVETVELGQIELASSYPTTLRGKTDIGIRPQVSGAITEVCVDEGQRVRKGQTLFTIDRITYLSAVEQAQAAVNSAQAAVNTASTNEASQKILYDKGIVSKIVWQQTADQLSQAKAALSQANAALTAAQKNLSYTVVTAPSDGVVGTIPFREGSYVSPSNQLTTISDNSEMYAYFSLNENDIISMTDNGTRSLESALESMPPVQLQLSNGAMYPLTGKIATVSGVIDSNTGAASVRALFPNPSGMLLSGASGTVLVPQNYSDVVIVPQTATFENQDMRLVYVVNDSNMTMPTPIQVAKLNDGKNFVVTGGLAPGQRIVVDGVNTVVRGVMPIQPVETTQPAANVTPAE